MDLKTIVAFSLVTPVSSILFKLAFYLLMAACLIMNVFTVFSPSTCHIFMSLQSFRRKWKISRKIGLCRIRHWTGPSPAPKWRELHWFLDRDVHVCKLGFLSCRTIFIIVAQSQLKIFLGSLPSQTPHYCQPWMSLVYRHFRTHFCQPWICHFIIISVHMAVNRGCRYFTVAFGHTLQSL